MDITKEKETVEEQLQSMSMEDVASCSSSILLKTPTRDDLCDDKDDGGLSEEDGMNVTILSKPPNEITRNEQPKGSSTGKKAKQLSGAGKKRFKRFMEEGYSREEARRLAELPVSNSTLEQNKRPRENNSDEHNTSGNNPRPVKSSRQAREVNKVPGLKQPAQERLNKIVGGSSGQGKGPVEKTKPTYADMANCVKVGILPKNYPFVEFTAQQQIVIQKAILLKVAQQRKQPIKPKFGRCLTRSGYLIIICKNKETSVWLKEMIPSLKPIGDIELAAVDEKDIPKREILIGFFPKSVEDETEDILGLLESQNDGLIVDAWKIIQRSTINKYHVELIFSVDGVSLETIQQGGFELDYKFGNAVFRRKVPRNNQEKPTTDEFAADQVGGEEHSLQIDSNHHEDPIDAEMSESYTDQLPSGPNDTRGLVNRDADIRTTMITTSESGVPKTHYGTAPGFRAIEIQEANRKFLGSRKTIMGENKVPQECDQHQKH